MCSKEKLVLNLFFHRSRGCITGFSIFFVPQYRKSSHEGLLCFKNVLLSKQELWKKERLSRFPVGYLLYISAEKICRVTLPCFENVW